MVSIMATDKFYIINGNVVSNLIVCTEEYAAQNKLIRHPVITEFGVASINWTYADGKFLPPPRDILGEWASVRERRNALLAASDVLVLPDRWSSFTPSQQETIARYRQTLRDIPQSFVDPKEVVFPDMPVIA